MVKLVIDANILFSILIKNNSFTYEVFLNESFQIYAPEYLFEEFEKYKLLIIQKTSRTEKELEQLLKDLKSLITIIKKEEFEIYFEKANNISPDINDSIYFALALKLNCPIWSNDKKLKEQNVIKIYSTQDLTYLFN